MLLLLLPMWRSSRGRGDDRRGQLLPMQLRRPEQNARPGRDRGRLRDLSCRRWRDAVLRRARLYEEKGLSRLGFISLAYHSLIAMTVATKLPLLSKQAKFSLSTFGLSYNKTDFDRVKVRCLSHLEIILLSPLAEEVN